MKRNIVLKLCTTSCLIASMTQNVYAEEIAVENKESTHKMSQVVVTATRTETLLENVSAKMEVITAEDIAKLGAYNLKDALRKATNIDVGGRGISIRGMGTSHALILVNGRKITPEDTPSGTAQSALNRVNVNNIERIEIIRGPSSAIYGADAMSGVINIITKKSEERSVLVGATTGSEEISNYYSFDTGPIGKWDALFDVRLTKLRSEASGSSRENIGDSYRAFFDLDFGYQIDDDNEIRFNAEYYEEDSEDSSNNGADMGTKFERSYDFATIYNGNTDNHDFSVTASVSQLHTRDKNFDNKIGKTDSDTTSDYDLYGIEAQDTWAVNEANLLTFGGEFKRHVSDNKEVRFSEGSYNTKDSYNGLETDYYAFYMQDEIILFDETLFIVPAVRYDEYESFDGQFSPKIGVTWKITENQRVKANYGLGFRAPSVRELYVISSRSGNPWLGDPDLVPEENEGYEFSYEAEYKNVSGSITYFNNEFTNLIDRFEYNVGDSGYNPDLTTTGTYWQYRNFLKSSFEGVEAKLSVDFLKYLTLTGQYHYLDAIDEAKNERFTGRAKDTYIATLAYSDDNQLSAMIWVEWVRDMWDSKRVNGKTVYHNDNYSVANVSVSKRFGAKEKYAFYAAVDNIFDTKDDGNEYDFLDPLAWRVGFEMKF